MGFGNIDIGMVLMQYVCLLFSLCVHEAAHAAMANYCGDPTARLMGRLTLDPRSHADPIGTIALPIIMMVTSVPFLFGWAKPVPFNVRNLNNIRRDPVLIALAGPGSNLLIALAVTLLMRIAVLMFGVEVALESPLFMFGIFLIMINLALMLFNCIPVPPLDGHYVLDYFLPPRGREMLAQIGPFGIIIAVVIGGRLIGPPLSFLFRAVLSYIDGGFGGLFA